MVDSTLCYNFCVLSVVICGALQLGTVTCVPLRALSFGSNDFTPDFCGYYSDLINLVNLCVVFDPVWYTGPLIFSIPTPSQSCIALYTDVNG